VTDNSDVHFDQGADRDGAADGLENPLRVVAERAAADQGEQYDVRPATRCGNRHLQKRGFVGRLQHESGELLPKGRRQTGIGDGERRTERLGDDVPLGGAWLRDFHAALDRDHEASAQIVEARVVEVKQVAIDCLQSVAAAQGVAVAHCPEAGNGAAQSRAERRADVGKAIELPVAGLPRRFAHRDEEIPNDQRGRGGHRAGRPPESGRLGIA